MNRYRGFLLPAVLIVVGLLFLLDNLGWLSNEAFLRLASLWPVLLVIVGIQVILNHTVDRRTAATAGLVVTVVLLTGAVAYAALGPAELLGSQRAHASERLNGLTSGTLSLDFGAGTVQVRQAALGDDMFRADVDYPKGDSAPDISLDRSNGTVTIQGSQGSFFPFIRTGRRQITIRLNDRIPWALEIGGGAASIRLDIAELHLTRLEFSGGASSIDATVPAPTGTVPIDISGGASNISMRGPKGTAWRIQVSGGATSVQIDGTSFGTLGGDVSRQSRGYDRATDRYAIQVSGGASHISFTFQ